MDKPLSDLPFEYFAYAIVAVLLLLSALWASVSIYAFLAGLLGRSGPEIAEYEYGQRAHDWLGHKVHRSRK